MIELYRRQTGLDVDTTNFPEPGHFGIDTANTLCSFNATPVIQSSNTGAEILFEFDFHRAPYYQTKTKNGKKIHSNAFSP